MVLGKAPTIRVKKMDTVIGKAHKAGGVNDSEPNSRYGSRPGSNKFKRSGVHEHSQSDSDSLQTDEAPDQEDEIFQEIRAEKIRKAKNYVGNLVLLKEGNVSMQKAKQRKRDKETIE